MTPDEIKVALQAAFDQCSRAEMALNSQQKQILLRSLGFDQGELWRNPLMDLPPEECRALLAFIREQERQNQSWKTTLLNDWLQGRDSGQVQFIRDRYGIQWLEQITSAHLEEYDNWEDGEVLKLQIGDRIEITNGLWEWVQEDGPCSREWFACTVITIRDAAEERSQETDQTCCVVRFDSGAEFEIQGIYAWNRPNWRRLQ